MLHTLITNLSFIDKLTQFKLTLTNKKTQKPNPLGKIKQYLDQDSITAEQLKLFHSLRMKSDDGVVIVNSFINNQTIQGFFAFENSSAEVSFCCSLTVKNKNKIKFMELKSKRRMKRIGEKRRMKHTHRRIQVDSPQQKKKKVVVEFCEC